MKIIYLFLLLNVVLCHPHEEEEEVKVPRHYVQTIIGQNVNIPEENTVFVTRSGLFLDLIENTVNATLVYQNFACVGKYGPRNCRHFIVYHHTDKLDIPYVAPVKYNTEEDADSSDSSKLNYSWKLSLLLHLLFLF